MRYYKTDILERVGFDFYCDTANRIVEARKEKDWTQEKLADESGVKKSRLSLIENVRIRITLEDLEKLAKALDRTVNWLMDAEIDSQIGQCLYLVWPESCPDFKIYVKATSKRRAALLFDKMFREMGVRYNNSRERLLVKLVGVPVTKKEIQDRFQKETSGDLSL